MVGTRNSSGTKQKGMLHNSVYCVKQLITNLLYIIFNFLQTELREKLRDLQKQSRTIPNVRQTTDEICSVEIRVKYAKEDRKKLVS